MATATMIPVGFFPAVQRDLFLSRCVRRDEDTPINIDTTQVAWDDMIINFESDGSVSQASVEVTEDINILIFTRRLESLLDCGAKSNGSDEWVLKFATRMSEYGEVSHVRRLLCDKIASLDVVTGETVGVLKIKRRAVTAGHAKVRLVPAEDSLQLIARHQTAQGLKAVWKSVLWRLRPQHGAPKNGWQDFSALEDLFDRQRWSDQTTFYVYANCAKISVTCVDGAIPELKNFSTVGGGDYCRSLDDLRQKLNGRRIQLFTYQGELVVKFEGAPEAPRRNSRW